ncbi:phosphoribosylanthranilate isomerase [Lutibacter oceani]|uniref:N-(5'-phosphoribosyl)anthranilate isomerase n=1 Tax=Lutibacter oceani TaxID=1853311 RepID=A0A3D9RTQ9_9FLAO|nr:phosphoribosylanthranilate isomerase [Lutibacter oceani]REE83340.1 phosphoribosylanthranilate isomerase [Lutibacter oceani]
MNKTHVKICCISSVQEANLAIKFGASALGLVGNMPSGPGIISDSLIAEIVCEVPKHIQTFLLTSETKVEEILKHHSKVNTTTIQIVDALTEGTHQQLKNELPTVKIVQVLHVLNESSIDEALQISKNVDTILLDSGNPNLKTKELGGTGRVHNWEISKKIVESVNIPVFLAGGLNPLNAPIAIQKVQPYGLDLCSGVRTHGKLDESKLKAFFQAIKQ